ncbi:MAG: alpha/beta hydrolase [Luteolibacter sp.]|uniref:serine aminopeptidase domain-containing protein n=1 Tax=Luteolibacter sp. TaxID=1962973 RepID=UPI0032662F9A
MKVLFLVLMCLATIRASEISCGEIGGAKFTIATPDSWQGRLVLIAHGFRPENAALGADLETSDDFTAPLLKQGWAVAITSYRRNGWIVDDAILDLKALRDHIAEKHGAVKRCVVMGNSMGGLIGTLIAEGAMDGVQGVVNIGAYLGEGQGEEFNHSLSWKPKVPILFLTNQDELAHPKHYRGKAGLEMTALWEVSRNGHCNTSDAENLQAVLAVNDWIDGKPPEKEKNGTIAPPDRPSTAKKDDDGLSGDIRNVSESWGNISSAFVAADLLALGLKIGDEAVVSNGSNKLAVKVVGFRSDAEQGKGALYLTPNGWIVVTINSGNAAKILGVKGGDRVRLSK